MLRRAAAGFRVAGALTEPLGGAAGARGRRLDGGWLSCGKRATQSLLQELRRACRRLGGRRLGRGWLSCGRRALHKASWRSWGARGRRMGRGWLSCGRRATQSLLQELRRAWPPLGPRLAFVWQAHYTEPLGGAAARVAAAGPRLAFISSHLISSHLISSHLSLCRSGGERHTQNFKLSYKSPAGVAAVSGLVRAIMTISARFGAQYVQ